MKFVLFVMERLGHDGVGGLRWQALRSFEADVEKASDLNGFDPFPVEIEEPGRYMIVPFDEVAMFNAKSAIFTEFSDTGF